MRVFHGVRHIKSQRRTVSLGHSGLQPGTSSSTIPNCHPVLRWTSSIDENGLDSSAPKSVERLASEHCHAPEQLPKNIWVTSLKNLYCFEIEVIMLLISFKSRNVANFTRLRFVKSNFEQRIKLMADRILSKNSIKVFNKTLFVRKKILFKICWIFFKNLFNCTCFLKFKWNTLSLWILDFLMMLNVLCIYYNTF